MLGAVLSFHELAIKMNRRIHTWELLRVDLHRKYHTTQTKRLATERTALCQQQILLFKVVSDAVLGCGRVPFLEAALDELFSRFVDRPARIGAAVALAVHIGGADP